MVSLSKSAHRLRLNDLILSSGDGDATSDTYSFDVYGDDFSMGSAESIEVTMRTLLQDGARVITQGYGVREVTFFVVLAGNDSVALADAEMALASNLGKRAELGWVPPDGWAPESVFDVETSSMEPGGPEDDDLLELQRNERVYRLRFVCQPFPREESLTVVPAISQPVVPLDEDVLDAGTSTARWSTRLGGVLTDQGAYLQVQNSRSPRAIFTPVAPVSLATQPYISAITHFGGAPYCFVNGVAAELVGAEYATLTSGLGTLSATRYYWRTNETSMTKVELAVNFASINAFDFADLRIRNLPPFTGTQRQSLRSIRVGGSARTQGAVQIAAPVSNALGTVVFYTTTADTDNVVSLRARRLSGSNTPAADATAVSGFNELMSGGLTFEVPVSELAPGKHQLLARLKRFTGSGVGVESVTWTARVFVGGTAVGPLVTGTTDVTVTTTAWRVVAVGTTDLPTTDLPEGSTATVRITLDGGGDVTYDDAWPLNLDTGAVTVVEGGTHRRLWIETATTARPRPAIYIGDAADQSDAFHDPALVLAWGVHEFAPDVTTSLIVTGDCEAADVSFEYYKRYLNFVAG